eukprot:3512658-Rhodomonas_salina.1
MAAAAAAEQLAAQQAIAQGLAAQTAILQQMMAQQDAFRDHVSECAGHVLHPCTSPEVGLA